MKKIRTVNANYSCSVPDCDKTNIAAHGLCHMHYKRQRTTGRLERDPMTKDQPCSVEGCERMGSTRGMCKMHYVRWRTHDNPNIVLRPGVLIKTECVIRGCKKLIRDSSALCHKHYHNHLYYKSRGHFEDVADYVKFREAKDGKTKNS